MSHIVKHSRVSLDHLFTSNRQNSDNLKKHNRSQTKYHQNNTDNPEIIN
jgi:hypothetical protein